jgi:hypothetical protein
MLTLVLVRSGTSIPHDSEGRTHFFGMRTKDGLRRVAHLNRATALNLTGVKMKTEQKKALLADVRRASHALGQILDGGHDFSAFPVRNVETLRGRCIDAMAGLTMIDLQLTAEIGTDNL